MSLKSCTDLELRPNQRCFLCSFSAISAFTSFFTRAAGRGLSTGKWIVPLEVGKPLSSFLKAAIAASLVGNKLQWSENTAKASSALLYRNVGIR